MQLLSPSAQVWPRIADRVGWLTFSVKGNWLAGDYVESLALDKAGGEPWMSSQVICPVHTCPCLTSLPYGSYLLLYPAQHGGICYILLHSLLSLLIKKYLLHFSHSFSNPDWDVRPEGEKPQRSLWINIYLIAAKRSPLLLVTAEMGRGKKTTLWGNQTKRAHKSHTDQQAAMYQWGGHWGNVPSMKKITYNYS